METPAILRPATACAPVFIIPEPAAPVPFTVGEKAEPCEPLVPATVPAVWLPCAELPA